MKIKIDVPADIAGLMKGLASYHEQSLDQWATEMLLSCLAGDCDAARSDIEERVKESRVQRVVSRVARDGEEGGSS